MYGRSDKNAADSATNPTTPAGFTATIYQALGIDPAGKVTDQQDRPIFISKGTPIKALFGS